MTEIIFICGQTLAGKTMLTRLLRDHYHAAGCTSALVELSDAADEEEALAEVHELVASYRYEFVIVNAYDDRLLRRLPHIPYRLIRLETWRELSARFAPAAARKSQSRSLGCFG